jgi:hypothetical protein
MKGSVKLDCKVLTQTIVTDCVMFHVNERSIFIFLFWLLKISSRQYSLCRHRKKIQYSNVSSVVYADARCQARLNRLIREQKVMPSLGRMLFVMRRK